MSTPEVIDQLEGLGFPEALRWRAGELWFSDMFRGQVLSWKPGQSPKVVVSEDIGGPKMPGGLGWLSTGELLVVDCLGRRVLRLGSNGELSVHIDLSLTTPYPLNDMHVDPDGTAWIGGYGFDPESETPVGSSIFRVSESGELSQSPPRFVFPNGCERSGRELVVAETFSDRVSFFDDRFAELRSVECESGSGPDGLTFDSSGRLFVAMAFSSKIEMLTPAGSFETVFELVTASGSPGGARGVFDCAMRPHESTLAFSSATLDEGYAMENDTGSITLIKI
jgi:sugar lactone lactonase YvrE